MKIGVSSPSFGVQDIETLLKRMIGKFDIWEVVCEEGHDLHDVYDQLEELLPSYDIDIQFHAPFSDINPAGINQRLWAVFMEELEYTLEKAHELVGPTTITIHPGMMSPATFANPQLAFDQLKISMDRLMEYNTQFGHRLALENMPEIPLLICKDPDQLLQCAGRMGICVDLGHAYTVPHFDRFLSLAKDATNVHFHDNSGNWDEHLTLGDGNMPLDRVLPLLLKRDGPVILEAKSIESAELSLEYIKTHS